MAGMHWLTAVTSRAGVTGASSFELEPMMAAPQAWAATVRKLGITEDDLAALVAKHFHLQLANLAEAQKTVTKLVPELVARKHTVLPLRENDRELIVATCDPMDMHGEQAISFASGRQPVFEIAPPAKLLAAIDERYAADSSVTPLLSAVDEKAASAISIDVVDRLADVVASGPDSAAAPVVKLTNLILRAAIEHGASEVEVGPDEIGGHVSFRIDTVWSTYMRLPVPAMNRVIGRIQLLGNLGIASRPEREGSARLRVEGHVYDLQFSAFSVGTRLAARIRLRDQQFTPRLGGLGLSSSELIRLRSLLEHGEGVVLVAGPEGNGKTTLLAAALRDLSAERGGAGLVTDLALADVPSVEQREAAATTDVTFANAIRDLGNRQMPVLVVSQLLDADAAAAALELAAHGTLVLAGMRDHGALEAVRSVLDLGVDPAVAATLLNGAVAIRLLRRLCERCAQPVTDPDNESADLQGIFSVAPVRRAVGCERCRQTGYRGVVPILDCVEVAGTLADRIRANASFAELADAVEGGVNCVLFEAARERVRAGETTLTELDRVLGPPRPEPTASARPRILLADDDPMVVLLTRTILEDNGFDVLEAHDGQEALDCIAAGTRVSLVILDLDMPRLSGHGVLDRLRAQLPTVALPVLVLTASANPADELRALEHGADDYVRKPIDPPRFLARIRATLRRAAGRA